MIRSPLPDGDQASNSLQIRDPSGWFYHWPVRGARPGTPILFWNRLDGVTRPVEIDFGDGSAPVCIEREISHTYQKAGIYTATLRSLGPADEPVEVRMRVVIEPDGAGDVFTK